MPTPNRRLLPALALPALLFLLLPALAAAAPASPGAAAGSEREIEIARGLVARTADPDARRDARRQLAAAERALGDGAPAQAYAALGRLYRRLHLRHAAEDVWQRARVLSLAADPAAGETWADAGPVAPPVAPPESAAAAAAALPPRSRLATRYVVIVVIDGVRYGEGLGDPALRRVPNMARRLGPRGVVYEHFYNDRRTLTVSGHASLLTGTWQVLGNSYHRSPHPNRPTLFERWREQTGAPRSGALIASSKRKLGGLARCGGCGHAAAYAAATLVPGPDLPLLKLLTPGYRDDSETVALLEERLRRDRPRLVLVQLREPDTAAHAGDWEGYLAAIEQSDRLVMELWRFLQDDGSYGGHTALFVTNDHGRHLDTFGGFRDHGDSCDGCRHISLLALGPDFAAGRRPHRRRSLIDIAPTVAWMLGIELPGADGSVMTELFGGR